MNTNENQAEFDPIESLLPWYASGTLASEEIPRVERALAAMPELQRRYALIIEERAAAVAVNQTLGAPSPRAVEKLFARLENAPAKVPKSRRFDLGSWLAARFSAWQPRSLAFAGMAAALIAMIEAGLLATTFFGAAQNSSVYQTASVSKTTAGQDGAILLIAFAPDATAAQILHFLEAHKTSVIGGPAAGGLFRIRVSDKPLTAKDLSAIVASMRNESAIVRFAAPTS